MCMGVDGVSLHVQCHYHIVCGQVPDTLICTDILLVYFDQQSVIKLVLHLHAAAARMEGD